MVVSVVSRSKNKISLLLTPVNIFLANCEKNPLLTPPWKNSSNSHGLVPMRVAAGGEKII